MALESDWNPVLVGNSLINQLKTDFDEGLLNTGCAASHGNFFYNKEMHSFGVQTEKKAATAFLFRLISELQFSGTVPMIDIQAYGDWLLKS